MRMRSSSHVLIWLCVVSRKAKAYCALQQKIETLDRDNSEAVGAEYGIGNSTIADLKKKERSLRLTREK